MTYRPPGIIHGCDTRMGTAMAKQVTKIVKQPTGPRRRVEVSDGVRVIMAGLNQAEKAAVETAFRSVTALLGLPVEYIVKAPSGDLRTARVTDDLCLVYRIEPAAVHVTDLLSTGAVRYLIHPGWAVRSKPAIKKRSPATKVKGQGKPVRNASGGN